VFLLTVMTTSMQAWTVNNHTLLFC